jgi:predicted nucleic acid-binding protein
LIIVADTSALFAAFDASQPEQTDASAVMDSELQLISPLVLTELDHLVHRDLGFLAALQVADALAARMTAGRYKPAEFSIADLAAAQDVRGQYKGCS